MQMLFPASSNRIRAGGKLTALLEWLYPVFWPHPPRKRASALEGHLQLAPGRDLEAVADLHHGHVDAPGQAAHLEDDAPGRGLPALGDELAGQVIEAAGGGLTGPRCWEGQGEAAVQGQGRAVGR